MKHGQLTEQEDSEDAARASVTPVASWKRCTSWGRVAQHECAQGQTGREKSPKALTQTCGGHDWASFPLLRQRPKEPGRGPPQHGGGQELGEQEQHPRRRGEQDMAW